jgi:hypothetical protein
MENTQKTIDQIQVELAKPYPSRVRTKRMGGKTISYYPWYEASSIFNAVTGGKWDYKIVKQGHNDKGKYEMTVGVTVYAADGTFYREGTGSEDSTTDSYGDPQSNAESMAIRRAFTKFQFGIHLYRGK